MQTMNQNKHETYNFDGKCAAQLTQSTSKTNVRGDAQTCSAQTLAKSQDMQTTEGSRRKRREYGKKVDAILTSS